MKIGACPSQVVVLHATPHRRQLREVAHTTRVCCTSRKAAITLLIPSGFDSSVRTLPIKYGGIKVHAGDPALAGSELPVNQAITMPHIGDDEQRGRVLPVPFLH